MFEKEPKQKYIPADSCFYMCRTLKELIIPADSVTSIRYEAFKFNPWPLKKR
jgi:hypothetical protein